MLFSDLRDALLVTLQTRIRNGELTERSLARLVGVSQPHVHNVLKGKRTMSPEMMDRFLFQLRLSTLDLVDRTRLTTYLEREKSDPGQQTYLPVLDGKIGPGHSWPEAVEAYEQFPVASSLIRRMYHPVVARLAFDVKMHPICSENDLVLLDQSRKARTDFDPEALYLIKRGRVGMIRRVRMLARAVYLVPEDSVDRPAAWERLPVESHQLVHFIRARASLIARETNWS